MKKKDKTPQNKKTKKDFLVVGIGASAGGVKALQDFFSTMPPNSGMAFVVILHLSPTHESNLAHILQAKTTMPVVQVQETHKVEPDHVYVIPPNQNLEMIDGVVRLAKPDKKRGYRVAIDVFFRTLADAYERNAVCVVLSGTGSDGTLGLKRIKESNGFAIVQEPLDAEFEEMPRSAIATGLADWVLPVAQMPEKLINFRESSERLHLTDGDDGEVAREIQAEQSLREILALLRVRTGHDFSNYKTPTLVRRIARHLQIHELEDIPSYLAFLREHPDEIISLQRNLLINVTNFFRDKDAFAALESEVIPALFEEKSSRDTVRVWSAGCASGEEAYSLAILLHEYAEKLNDPPRLQVFATDIDGEAIQQAREHLYPETIKTDVSEDRLKRFFVREGSNYRVKKEIREMVLFAPHNLLRDPPFSKLDLIACRNVLIYLNRETQDRIMEVFHFALNHGGFLFLGSSETAENVPTMFTILDKKYRIYSRRPTQQAGITLPRMPVIGQWQVKLPESIEKAGSGNKAFALGEVHFKLLERFAPPSVMINQDFDVLYMSEEAGRYLRFKGGEPSRNILKLVNPDLLPDLRAALFAAQRENRSSEFQNISAEIDGKETFVNLSVRTVDSETDGREFLLVVFDEEGREKSAKRRMVIDKSGAATAEQKKSDARDSIVERLEEELQRTKDSLRATIEQHEISIEELKASNEELQAINEELRSASEELETSKEEAQSVNEELTTVNHELKEKIDEATKMNSDLQNLMASTDIATIFLDKTLRIKRYTPPIEKIFNLTTGDIGRPLEHFTHRLDYENLTDDAQTVLERLTLVEREVSDRNGNFYLARFLPYRTIDDRIDGVVLNFIDITERKRAEEALRKSEERFRRAIEEAPIPVIMHAEDGEVLQISRSWTELTGYTLEDKDIIQTWLTRAYGFGGERVRDAMEQSFAPQAGKPMRAVIFDITTRSGEHRMWSFSASTPGTLRDGRRFVVGMAEDIPERRNAEEALHESEERTRIAIEAAELATWEWNLETNEVIWNERHFELFGMKPKKGKHSADDFFRHIHPDDRERVRAELQQAIEKKGVFNTEFCVVREDGATMWMSGYGRVTDEINGKAARMSGVMFDITDRKAAQESLRKSEEHLQLMMESVKDYAIITFDLSGKITRWNKGAEKIFGWTEKEAVGQSTHLIFTPEDCAAGAPERELDKALRNGKAEDERWHVRKDGSRFYASGIMQVLKDGELEGFVKIARDQTQRMLAEQVLRDKEMLQQFVRTQEDERRRIARDIHDHLGQQLTTLRLKIDNLKNFCGTENFSNKAKTVKFIDELSKTSEQIDRDVDFIAWELRPVALDDLGLRVMLTNFIREWSHYTAVKAEFHTSNIGKKSLSNEIEINLYRIAQETLNNIHKHAKATNVDVILERRKNDLVLIIEDDGIGFNPKNKNIQKKGIGIIGINERARILGGSAEIESQKGKGTTVFIRVPIKYSDDEN